MRRWAAAISVLTAVLAHAVPAAAASYPTPTKLTVNVSDQNPFLSASGSTDPYQLVDMALSTPGGAIKAVDRAYSGSSGDFSLQFGLEQRIDPGDRLRITLGDNPAWSYTLIFSRLQFTAFDAAAGTISGKVTPRKPRVRVQAAGQRLVPDPATVVKQIAVNWRTGGSGKATDPTGRFVVKPLLSGDGWQGSYRGMDQLIASYVTRPVAGDANFSFVVSTQAQVPALYSYVGAGLNMFFGLQGESYTATLRAAGGRAKAVSRFSIDLMPLVYVVFRSPAGTQVDILPGDAIVLAGLGGFAARVPRLSASIRTLADKVRVVGPPNARIQVSFVLHDDQGSPIPASPPSQWVKTDAMGAATADPGAGVDLRTGDRVSLVYHDARGNVWIREVQSLPPAP